MSQPVFDENRTRFGAYPAYVKRSSGTRTGRRRDRLQPRRSRRRRCCARRHASFSRILPPRRPRPCRRHRHQSTTALPVARPSPRVFPSSTPATGRSGSSASLSRESLHRLVPSSLDLYVYICIYKHIIYIYYIYINIYIYILYAYIVYTCTCTKMSSIKRALAWRWIASVISHLFMESSGRSSLNWG